MVEIKVLDVQRDPQSMTLRITLEAPFWGGSELTDIGNRAMRILRKNVKLGGREIQRETILLHDASSIGQINTRDSLQQEFDRYATVPIELRFSERVFAYGREKRELYTREDVAHANKEGSSVYLYLFVQSNLPFTERDCSRIERLVPASTAIDKDNPCRLEVGVRMAKPTQQDLWAFADELRLVVRGVVV